jgi:hypothetical protein
MKKGFIFYASFRQAIGNMPDETQLKLYNAIADYALSDIEPDFADDNIARGFFALVKPQIDANAKRREIGAKGGRPRKESVMSEQKEQETAEAETNGYEKETTTENEGYAEEKGRSPNEKSKEKEKVKAKVNGKRKQKEKENALSFTDAKERGGADAPRADRPRRPTKREIQDYCVENGYTVDAQRFYDFYEAKGWRIGNTPMSNWRAAVRTWANRGAADRQMQAHPQSGGVMARTKRAGREKIPQHDYTDEQLESLLVDLDVSPDGE